MGKRVSLKNDVVNASEIGQFMYCSQSWFLQRSGYKPESPDLERGRKIHVDLGSTIDTVNAEIRRSYWYVFVGVLFLLLSILILLVEVI